MILAKELGFDNLALAYLHAADGVYLGHLMVDKHQPNNCFQDSQEIMAWYTRNLKKTKIPEPVIAKEGWKESQTWAESSGHTIYFWQYNTDLVVRGHGFNNSGLWIKEDKPEVEYLMNQAAIIPNSLANKFIWTKGEWKPRPECFVPAMDIVKNLAEPYIVEVFIAKKSEGWALLPHSSEWNVNQVGRARGFEVHKIYSYLDQAVAWANSTNIWPWNNSMAPAAILKQFPCEQSNCPCHTKTLAISGIKPISKADFEIKRKLMAFHWYKHLVDRMPLELEIHWACAQESLTETVREMAQLSEGLGQA